MEAQETVGKMDVDDQQQLGFGMQDQKGNHMVGDHNLHQNNEVGVAGVVCGSCCT